MRDLNMIQRLIKIARILDNNNLHHFAEEVDDILIRVSQNQYFSNTDPKTGQVYITNVPDKIAPADKAKYGIPAAETLDVNEPPENLTNIQMRAWLYDKYARKQLDPITYPQLLETRAKQYQKKGNFSKADKYSALLSEYHQTRGYGLAYGPSMQFARQSTYQLSNKMSPEVIQQMQAQGTFNPRQYADWRFTPEGRKEQLQALRPINKFRYLPVPLNNYPQYPYSEYNRMGLVQQIPPQYATPMIPPVQYPMAYQAMPSGTRMPSGRYNTPLARDMQNEVINAPYITPAQNAAAYPMPITYHGSQVQYNPYIYR